MCQFFRNAAVVVHSLPGLAHLVLYTYPTCSSSSVSVIVCVCVRATIYLR